MSSAEEHKFLAACHPVGPSREFELTTPSGTQQRLSVIVPLAPGETEVDGLLAQLRALPAGSELLLVGDGVRPGVVADWPASLPFRFLASEAGRARAMNEAAGQARGCWLWFLHADTRLDAGALPALERFVERDEAALGWFGLRFRADGPRLTCLNGWGANARAALLGMPFGDQGLVLPAARFAAVGGYDETAPFGEDHLLVWAIRGQGLPLRRIDATLSTSARKYARHGWWRTTRRHWLATASQACRAWRRNRAGRN